MIELASPSEVMRMFEKYRREMDDMLYGWMSGNMAGRHGLPRDWVKGNNWHRGYLRGRLQRYKETGKMWI